MSATLRASLILVCLGVAAAAPAQEENPHAHYMMAPTQPAAPSETHHVPPDPPQHAMRDMSEEEMTGLMEMDDTSAFFMLQANSFEWRSADEQDSLSWDAQAWYGTDDNKLWLKTEGDRTDSATDARTELLWDRPIARWWSAQAGVRHDIGEGPARTWAALGVQGLAPYYFEVEATAYVGEEGRTALRFSGEYALLLTQRLILQPQLEFNVFGKNDPRNLIGAGLSDTELSLRLRYEVRRELAPYIGVAWTQRYGRTADLARAAAHDVSEVQWLAGVRWWF